MFMAGFVYVGVVLAATTLFISFVLTAFPNDAYFSRLVMIVAGLMIGGSMLAFPVSLHNWAISGLHRNITTGLYYGEMIIIALNTVVSFAALLFEYSNTPLPAWITWYEPFSIVSIVYTLAAWGTVFLTDPMAQAKANELKADQTYLKRIGDKRMEFLDSIEGEEAIRQASEIDIAKRFNPANLRKVRGHFGKAREEDELADSLFSQKKLTAEAPFRPDPEAKG
jgi:hypothetical protein